MKKTEAIQDANDEYSTFDASEKHHVMQVCEWTQSFDPEDGESNGSETTGNGYSVDRYTGKATPNF
jgi:hypothetical protein